MRATDQPNDRPEGGPGLDWVLEVVKRRKWVALVAFATVLAGVGALALWLPNLYRAKVTVLVETGQISEAFVRQSVTSELETRLQRIRQELTSRARLGLLIPKLGLYPDLRRKGIDGAIDRMRDDLDLELEGVNQQSARGQTIAFNLTYRGRDPNVVAQVVNLLAGLYVEENTRMRAGQATKMAEFLKNQLAEARKELDAQERRGAAFKLSHLGELPQQVEANLGSLERLNMQLRLNGENQIRALDRRDRLELQLADASSSTPAAPPGASPSAHAAQLSKLRQELSDLRRQFSDAYPDVVRVQNEIAALEGQAAAGADGHATSQPPPGDAKTRLAQSLGEVERELASLRQHEASLRRAIAAYEQRVDNAPKRQEEIQALSQDYTTAKERYDNLQKRYEEAQLAENLERGQQVEQFKILDPATPPREPAAPGRFRLIAAGLVLALMCAAAAVVGAEKLDTSFHSLDDLRTALGGATLFSIPVIQTAADTRRHWRRVAVMAVVVVLGLGLIVTGVRYVAMGNERIVRLVARV